MLVLGVAYTFNLSAIQNCPKSLTKRSGYQHVFFFLGYQNGARTNVPKVLFVITDGSQTGSYTQARRTPAELLKKMNVPIIVLGIGGVVNKAEMDILAGSSKNVFLSKDMDTLISPDTLDRVIKTACDSIRK